MHYKLYNTGITFGDPSIIIYEGDYPAYGDQTVLPMLQTNHQLS